jgi:hypothetical protein
VEAKVANEQQSVSSRLNLYGPVLVTHGGTLRDLIKEFRDYICTGEPLHPGYLGPERFNDSNIWGCDEAGMQSVREQAGALPVFRQPDVEAA